MGWLGIKNGTDPVEEIPPFAVMEPCGYDLESHSIVVRKPTVSSGSGMMINGPFSVPVPLEDAAPGQPNSQGQSGTGQGTFDNDATVAYDSETIYPAVGDTWGSVAGSWKIGPSQTGFKIVSIAFQSFVHVCRTSAATVAYRNHLINGAFAFQQHLQNSRLPTSGNYCFDRWYLQHDASPANSIRIKTTTYGNSINTEESSSFGDLYNISGGNAGVLLCQPLEALNSWPLIGQSLEFSLKARVSSGNGTVRIGIWEWDGGTDHADSKALAASWTTNVPTFSYAPVATANITVDSSGWTSGTLAFTPTANTVNLVAGIWIEGLGNGTALRVATASIHPAGATLWSEPVFTDEALRCYRYFFRPNWLQIPVWFVATKSFYGTTTDPTTMFGDITIPFPMRKFPTLENEITNISTVAGTGNLIIYDYTTGDNLIGNATANATLTVDWRQNVQTLSSINNPKLMSGCLTISIATAPNFLKGLVNTNPPHIGDQIRLQVGSDFHGNLSFNSEI